MWDQVLWSWKPYTSCSPSVKTGILVHRQSPLDCIECRKPQEGLCRRSMAFIEAASNYYIVRSFCLTHASGGIGQGSRKTSMKHDADSFCRKDRVEAPNVLALGLLPLKDLVYIT